MAGGHNELTPKFAPFFGMVRYAQNANDLYVTGLIILQAGVSFAVCSLGRVNEAFELMAFNHR